MIIGVVATLLVAGCGTDVTESEEYRALVAERDGLAAERDGLIAEVAGLEEALGATDADLVTSRSALVEAESLLAATSASATVAPFHAVPAETVPVTGTAACTFSDNGTNPETGGSGFLVICSLDLSDPRVSGVERHDRFRFIADGEEAAVWIAEDAVLTNAGGAWRGTAQAADNTVPYGEAHYVGEGAYEGLEFHYYFGGADVELRGWISSVG
jgi:hypothetical protein